MMRKEVKVSVIVPVYNVEKYLERCINSIIHQSYNDLEILLIDDGSTDSSGTLADRWAQRDVRIRVIHQRNMGLSAARNTGIDAATGSHLIFVDSDDWIHEDMVAHLIERLDRADIVCCGMIRASDTVTENMPWYSEEQVVSNRTAIGMLIENKQFTSHAQKNIYPKYVFDHVKFPEGKLFEDIRTMHKLFLQVDRICIIPECLYYYYARDDSITNVVRLNNRIEWFNALKERSEDLAGILTPAEKESIRSQMAVVMSLAMVQNHFTDEEIAAHQEELQSIVIYLRDRSTQCAVRKYATVSQNVYYWLARIFSISANKIYNCTIGRVR